MTKNISFVILFLLFLFASCGQKKACDVEPGVDEVIRRHLKVISDINPGSAIHGQQYISLFFFERTTGMSSHVNYGDISVYEDQEAIDTDLYSWSKWYEEEKCQLHKDSLLEKEKNIIKNNPWIVLD